MQAMLEKRSQEKNSLRTTLNQLFHLLSIAGEEQSRVLAAIPDDLLVQSIEKVCIP